MAGPSMAMIKASLERSFHNWSLNEKDHQESTTTAGDGEDPPENGGSTLELNSEMSLPFHWEQCLDLKSGEIYYINWRTGMKSKEDPRISGDYYYSEDDESSNCDSDEGTSSSEPSPYSYSRDQQLSGNEKVVQETCSDDQQKNEKEDDHDHNYKNHNNNVLVVSGCKSCFTFYMVPSQLEICPKCCGQLVHF